MDNAMPWIILVALLVWMAGPLLYSVFLRWRSRRVQQPAHEMVPQTHNKAELEARAAEPEPQTQHGLQLELWSNPEPAQLDDAQPTSTVEATEPVLLASLPVALPPLENSSPDPPIHRAPEEIQVLVVDDSKLLRVKISRLLIKHGYRVSLAEDGAEAARQMMHTLPHLLITDVDMPVMNGLELSHHVRSQPQTADLPIIMITSAQEKYAPQAAAIGVKVVLAKPYRDDELIAQVTSSLTASPAKCKPPAS